MTDDKIKYLDNIKYTEKTVVKDFNGMFYSKHSCWCEDLLDEEMIIIKKQ